MADSIQPYLDDSMRSLLNNARYPKETDIGYKLQHAFWSKSVVDHCAQWKQQLFVFVMSGAGVCRSPKF